MSLGVSAVRDSYLILWWVLKSIVLFRLYLAVFEHRFAMDIIVADLDIGGTYDVSIV